MAYTLTKESPGKAKRLGQGYLHFFTDPALNALGSVPAVPAPASTYQSLNHEALAETAVHARRSLAQRQDGDLF